MRIAAALSYTTLLALVPLGAIAFAILRAFPVFDDVRDRIKAMMFENFMPESVAGAQSYFDHFIGQTQGLTSIGIVALAVTAIMLLATIEGALNSIFHVKAQRPFVPRMMMFWAVITLGPLLLGGSLSLGTYLYALTEWTGAGKVPGLGGFLTRLLPSVLAIFAFTLFYTVVPYRPVRMRHALIGAVVAGVLFGLVRKLFALYITAFPAYQTIYGAVSTIPIFLIWMYVSWAIVLIGAEITASLPHWGRARAAESFAELPPARRLEAALSAMEALWRKTRGEKVEEEDITDVRGADRNEALEMLRQYGFAGLSDRGDWLLARDPAVLTIAELAHGLGLMPDPADIEGRGGPVWRTDLKRALKGTDGSGVGRTLVDLFTAKN